MSLNIRVLESVQRRKRKVIHGVRNLPNMDKPHLDYAVHFWSAYYRMVVKVLESVQRRMTKVIQRN